MINNRRQVGFTLIELVVVIALLALVAAVAAPAAGRLFNLSTPADDAERLATALRQARMAAMSERRPRRVWIDPKQRQWRHAGDVGVISGVAPITVTVPPAGRDRTGSSVVFLADGSATGGQILLGQGQGRRSVDVDWLTGNVAISRP